MRAKRGAGAPSWRADRAPALPHGRPTGRQRFLWEEVRAQGHAIYMLRGVLFEACDDCELRSPPHPCRIAVT